jgi:hypothetical protein
MLAGYSVNKNGVIHQHCDHTIKYDREYIARGLATFPLAKVMSFIRLGYIIGAIKKVPNSICDVGYGAGDFLKACEGSIKERSGIEINGWELPSGCKEGDYSSYYEVYTFFDVLEHFIAIDFVEKLKCKYLVITVPSCNHGEDDTWFINWKHRKPNEHIWHFNSMSLAKQMREYGFLQICTTSIEDVIRKGKSPNTITSVFKKIRRRTSS